MKTILISLGILSIHSIYGSNAGNGTEVSIEASAVKNIKEHIVVAKQNVGHEQKVEILFTTNVDGRVNFVLAKTSNKELKKELEAQFNTISLPGFQPDAVNSVILTLVINK